MTDAAKIEHPPFINPSLSYPKDFMVTPLFVRKVVEEFLGPDYFDPCPRTPTVDGLDTPWGKRTYVNPPFSRYAEWAQYGINQHYEGASEIIWMCNHDHSTQWFKDLLAHSDAMCLVERRIDFLHPDTLEVLKNERGRPVRNRYFQTIFYMGGRREEFLAQFQELGFVVYT